VLQTVLEHGGSFAGVNRKVQLKPLRWAPPEEGSSEPPHIVEALLILKHGGVLTHAGRQQVRSTCPKALATSGTSQKRVDSTCCCLFSCTMHCTSRYELIMYSRGPPDIRFGTLAGGSAGKCVQDSDVPALWAGRRRPAAPALHLSPRPENILFG
jgi:hypothetical protein